MEIIVFYIIFVILIVSGISVISQKSSINSAISLIVNLLAMAVLYFLLNSQLLASMQIIIYAGAIVVLFLFAIMIFGNLTRPDPAKNRLNALTILIPIIFILLVVISLTTITNSGEQGSIITFETKILAKTLFTKYLLGFELISILFLTGLIGVVVLAKKQ